MTFEYHDSFINLEYHQEYFDLLRPEEQKLLAPFVTRFIDLTDIRKHQVKVYCDFVYKNQTSEYVETPYGNDIPHHNQPVIANLAWQSDWVDHRHDAYRYSLNGTSIYISVNVNVHRQEHKPSYMQKFASKETPQQDNPYEEDTAYTIILHSPEFKAFGRKVLDFINDVDRFIAQYPEYNTHCEKLL